MSRCSICSLKEHNSKCAEEKDEERNKSPLSSSNSHSMLDNRAFTVPFSFSPTMKHFDPGCCSLYICRYILQPYSVTWPLTISSLSSSLRTFLWLSCFLFKRLSSFLYLSLSSYDFLFMFLSFHCFFLISLWSSHHSIVFYSRIRSLSTFIIVSTTHLAPRINITNRFLVSHFPCIFSSRPRRANDALRVSSIVII